MYIMYTYLGYHMLIYGVCLMRCKQCGYLYLYIYIYSIYITKTRWTCSEYMNSYQKFDHDICVLFQTGDLFGTRIRGQCRNNILLPKFGIKPQGFSRIWTSPYNSGDGAKHRAPSTERRSSNVQGSNWAWIDPIPTHYVLFYPLPICLYVNTKTSSYLDHMYVYIYIYIYLNNHICIYI